MKRDPSGYWSSIGIKGEAEGHPFRGNQYREGEGSSADEVKVTNARQHVYNFAKAGHGKQELGYAILENGTPVTVKGTKDNQVEYPDEIIDKTTYLAHNHHNGSSFSDADVACFAGNPKMQRMEVICPDGTLYRMDKLKSCSGVYTEMWTDWNFIEMELRPKYKERFKAGEDQYDLWREHTDETMGKLAAKYSDYFTYTKGRVDAAKGAAAPPVYREPRRGGVYVLDDSRIATPPYND